MFKRQLAARASIVEAAIRHAPGAGSYLIACWLSNNGYSGRLLHETTYQQVATLKARPPAGIWTVTLKAIYV